MTAIAVIGTLDTKSAELRFLKERIEERGAAVILIDTGIIGEPGVEPSVSAAEVARDGGSTLEQLRVGEKAVAIDTMSRGAATVVRRLFDEGAIDGAVAIGGGQGTTICAAALRALPVGVPKVLVSTIVAIPGVAGEIFGTKDVTLMYSVVDISGLNDVARSVLGNAADAIAGMAAGYAERVATRASLRGRQPLRVATTMFGVTTKTVDRMRAELEQAGVEVLVFAATGVGDRAMEDLLLEGGIDGVVDVTISQVGQGLVRGQGNAGPKRLEVAGDLGLPQIVVPGGLDIVNSRRPPMVDPLLEEARSGRRKHFAHNPLLTVMRPTVEESARIGAEVARKLNQARGPVRIVWPGRGLSEYSTAGGPLHDPEADAALLDALKRDLRGDIPLIELDCAITDPAFAHELATQFLALAPEREPSPAEGA